jgi:hypothetical protein
MRCESNALCIGPFLIVAFPVGYPTERKMKKLVGCLLAVTTCICGNAEFAAEPIRDEAIQPLKCAQEVTLYSLEADHKVSADVEGFYHFPVLGTVRLKNEEAHDAAKAFLAAIRNGGHEALCFKPRHALRVVRNGHTYDYLLCYECQSIEIIKDGHQVLETLEASGSPLVLNNLLKSKHINLSSN